MLVFVEDVEFSGKSSGVGRLGRVVEFGEKMLSSGQSSEVDGLEPREGHDQFRIESAAVSRYARQRGEWP